MLSKLRRILAAEKGMGFTMTSEKKILGIVFANMHDTAIKELTDVRTMGSVPFGGRYRLIDFTLSNMVNSGIDEVGLITKANYQSLMDHLGSGREWDLARKRGGLHILPPFGHATFGIYRGRLEALGSALSFIHGSKSRYVVMADCDTISNMDLRPIVDAHIEKEADITIAYNKTKVNVQSSAQSTFISMKDDGRVMDVLVNPMVSGEFNRSLNIVVMEKNALENMVVEALSRGFYDFERDILQKKAGQYRIYGYEYTGLVQSINSMKDYYDVNMALLDSDVRAQLFPEKRPVYTKIRDEVPAKYGLDATARNSLVADGCIIEGDVENSILFRGVHVQKGAKIRNSILMQGTKVGCKCIVQYAITDKDVTIKDYRMLNGSADYPVFVAKGGVV